MDPNACCERIAAAAAAGDHDEMTDALGDLQTWLARGGFPPNAGGVHALARALAYLLYVLRDDTDTDTER